MLKLKPSDYKTPVQWMSEGKIAINDSVIETCITTNKYGAPMERNGVQLTYQYVAPQNVREATEQEQEEFWQHHRRPAGVKNPAPIKEKEIIIPIANNKHIIIFDTETTGFSNSDEILQLSIFKKNNMCLLDTYIKPVNKTYWGVAMTINHITPQMVKDSPTANELLFKVKDIFENADIIVGHNVSFDARMISNIFGVNIPKEKLYDTLSQFKKDKSEGPYKLENAVEFYCGKEILDSFLTGAHSSSVDTLATVAVFNAQQERIKEQCHLSNNVLENNYEQLELDIEY